MIVGVRAAVAVRRSCSRLARQRGAGQRCGDQRPAGAALRQPQVRPGQRARRAGPRTTTSPGSTPAPAAGRDHRRIRELAAHPRLRRRRGLGLPLAAVGQAHRAGAAEGEDRSRAAATPSRDAHSGDDGATAVRRARQVKQLQRDAGAASSATASTAGSSRSGSGASIRTRRSSSPRHSRIAANGSSPQWPARWQAPRQVRNDDYFFRRSRTTTSMRAIS